MLGAKDVAFPRLNLMSLYIYCIGATLLRLRPVRRRHLRAAIGMAPARRLRPRYRLDLLHPLQHQPDPKAVVPATIGAFILGFSSILTGVNFIATIHTLRPKGMTWFRMPLFLWATLCHRIIQILATPVLAITLLLLVAERTLHVGIFDPPSAAIRSSTSTSSGSTPTRPSTS